MMKTRKWIIPTELGEINVEYSRGWNDGEYSLTVNGNSHRMQSRAVLYADIDYEFKVADHTLHFVAAGAKCDLAFDGFFNKQTTLSKTSQSASVVFNPHYSANYYVTFGLDSADNTCS